MLENIVPIIENILFLLIAVILYGFLVVGVYPWLTLRLCYCGDAMGDRGIRRVRFPDGRGVIYRPDPRVRRYVPDYALLSINGDPYIRLHLQDRVTFIRYDVVAFDVHGRMLDILRVSERVVDDEELRTGRTVRLPQGTAYTRLMIRQVDGIYTGRDRIACYSRIGMGIMAGLTVITTVLMAWVLYRTYTALLSTWEARPDLAAVLVVAAFLGILSAAWILFRYWRHERRVINR